MSYLEMNLKDIEARIQAACDRSGRSREEVTLVAVSKTHPAETLQEAYDLGVRVFGENKVQELQVKMPALPDDIEWHMIGHLQRNKIKYIAPRVTMIHSVDSLRLAEAIDKEAEKCGRVIPVLLEVNAAGEESKFGVTLDEADEIAMQIDKLPNIRLCGLMTIAPYVENPEENRIVFKMLRNKFVDIKRQVINNSNMSVLSMGMTGDFEVAIEEGATHVRVGTGIFGRREYDKL